LIIRKIAIKKLLIERKNGTFDYLFFGKSPDKIK